MTGALAAVASSEVKVLWRNRTAAVTAVGVPLVMAVFFVVFTGASGDGAWGLAASLQLIMVLAFGLYVTSAQTVVSRRHFLVLKRLRTTEASDTAILVGVAAPALILAVLESVCVVVIDAVGGAPAPANPLAPVLAVLLGIPLYFTAAMATTVITGSPERAQVTTLPLSLLGMAGAGVLPVLGTSPLTQALTAVPGAGVPQLVALGFAGDAWHAGPGGIPDALPAVVSLLAWTAIFGLLAARHFRWDPRR